MAKKDTYLALLRRGVDDNTAMILADAGLKIGDLKKITKEKLVENYGLKAATAKAVLDVINTAPSSQGKQRFLTNVLAPEQKKKKMDKIEETRFQRQQKDILADLDEEKERLKMAKVEKYRAQKSVMNRLGKTCELLIKLENNLHDESKEDQKVKIRDQLETRNMEAARDWELLNIEGLPQDIVDFRRKLAPKLCMYACPECGEEMDPRGGNVIEDQSDFSFVCWECEVEFHAPMANFVDEQLNNGSRIKIDPKMKPREKVVRKPKKKSADTIKDLMIKDLEATGASAEEMAAAVEASDLTGGLMSIDEWIDQTLAAKGYIQAQEHREDFILATGAGATKFNKWMKKAGLVFNKQTGQWTRWAND